MEPSLTMYALDINSNVIATKEAVELFRGSSVKMFFKEVKGAHAVWARAEKGWIGIHCANDSWYLNDCIAFEKLPKPFQMYLMLLGE